MLNGGPPAPPALAQSAALAASRRAPVAAGQSVQHAARHAVADAQASSASNTLPFVSIPTQCTVTAAISGTTPIR